ncbi:LysR substrate-binding domain-containing protein [Acidovorax sp.]|uniref:LysR family transcriptional regulator n=1 Tax=Acidovorax sp. TaxID=1872122 RepID=UPI0039199C9C
MDQLRCLRVFVQVVADGSFAAAARRLDLAPTVATRAVAELEAHLGARLLQRTTRRLALTEIGETYLETARNVLAQLDEADALAGAATRQPGGTVKLVCPPAFLVHQMAPVLPLFLAQHPRITVELVAAAGGLAVVDDAADLSILSVGGQPPEGDFVARPLGLSTFVLCASPAYLHRCGTPQVPEDLAAHQGVAPALAGQRSQVQLHWCGPGETPASGVTATVAVALAAAATSHIDTMLALALAGVGVVGLPSFVACGALKAGQLQRVLPHWRSTVLHLYIAMPTRKHVPARTRLLRDFLLQQWDGEARDSWLLSPSR